MSEKLSNIAKGRSRTATGQFVSITTAQEARAEAKKPRPTIAGQEARIAELEAQITRLQVSNDHNAAEFARAIEEKRLTEQGRDAAIESRDRFQSDLVAAGIRERSIATQLAKAVQERGSLWEQLQETSNKLQQATYDIGCLKTSAKSLIPMWVQITAAFVCSFFIAYFAHRAGFTAAMEARP